MDHYNDWLTKQEELIWKALSPLIKLTKEQVDAMLNADYLEAACAHLNTVAQKYMPGKKPSQETIACVREVLHDLGIAQDKITICLWQEISEAASLGTSILINEQALFKLPMKSRKFIIAHELNHYLHHDGEMINLIKQLLLGEGITEKDMQQHDHPINQYRRFIEIRADICASLVSPDYAEGNVLCVQAQLAEDPDYQSVDHPTFKERLVVAQDISKLLTA